MKKNEIIIIGLISAVALGLSIVFYKKFHKSGNKK